MADSFQYYTEDGVSLNLNLGVKGYLFDGNKSEDISLYYKSSNSAIRWFHRSKRIEISEPKCYLVGYPSPSLEKVIIIYPMNHKSFGAPENAIIYNADGSLYCRLKIPALVSEIAKKREEFHHGRFSMVHFDNVKWAKNNKGEIVSAITISFDRDWQETRELIIETCEFGECLSSGRR